MLLCFLKYYMASESQSAWEGTVHDWNPNPTSSACATLGSHLLPQPQFIHPQRMTQSNSGLRAML